jgi:hypothetical protein
MSLKIFDDDELLTEDEARAEIGVKCTRTLRRWRVLREGGRRTRGPDGRFTTGAVHCRNGSSLVSRQRNAMCETKRARPADQLA